MRTQRIAALVLAVTFLLAACGSKAISFTPTHLPNRAMVLGFTRSPTGTILATVPTCYDGTIGSIQLADPTGSKVLWAVEQNGFPTSANGEHLRSFIVGDAPPGFRTMTKMGGSALGPGSYGLVTAGSAGKYDTGLNSSELTIQPDGRSLQAEPTALSC